MMVTRIASAESGSVLRFSILVVPVVKSDIINDHGIDLDKMT